MIKLCRNLGASLAFGVFRRHSQREFVAQVLSLLVSRDGEECGSYRA